jgi:prolyl-tRNA editing enzyme YbaK/EbsC (Cys-tRNA(Pro) deacylase)
MGSKRANASRGYARFVEWPEPVERVAAFAREAGAELRLEEFAIGTPTARDAAEAVGCDLAAIGKSIAFDCDGRIVVALIPGDRRADARKIAALAGAERARIVPAADVEAATGFPPGSVAPFPLPMHVHRVLIDRLLLAHPVVWVGAGSDRHMAGLSPVELMRLTRGESADVVE